MNFDPSLESNTETLAPFRRPFTERGPLDIAADAISGGWERAKNASLQPEPDDHGLSERQKLTELQKAYNPLTSLPETFHRMNREAQEQFWRGAGQLTNWRDPWTVAKGASDIGLGASSYVMSPVNALVRSIASQPLEDVIGLPRQYVDAIPSALTSAPRVVSVAKAVASVPRLVTRMLSR